MKRMIRITALALIVALASTSCVSNQTYNAFVAKADYQHEVLACEARVDAYENRLKSDEPDPTRRDEPLPTRRDEPDPTRRDLEACLDEFARVTQGADPSNYPKCQLKLLTCVNDTMNGFPKCNGCFDVCMASATGTWPDATCDLTP